MKAKRMMDYNCAALILCAVTNMKRREALKCCGIKVPSDNRCQKKVIADCEKDKIKKLYNDEKLSILQISKIYNTSDTNIRNFMSRVGIESRRRGRPREGIF